MGIIDEPVPEKYDELYVPFNSGVDGKLTKKQESQGFIQQATLER